MYARKYSSVIVNKTLKVNDFIKLAGKKPQKVAEM